MLSRFWVASALILVAAGAAAATFSPPMVDINSQCSAKAKRNVTAMSECIVAQSEARAEILQKWDKVPDATAEKCVKESRKAKRLPYGVIAQCIAASAPPPAAAPAPAAK